MKQAVIYSTIAHVNPSGRVTIPSLISEVLGWEENDVFEIYPEPDRIVLDRLNFQIKPEDKGYVLTPKE